MHKVYDRNVLQIKTEILFDMQYQVMSCQVMQNHVMSSHGN